MKTIEPRIKVQTVPNPEVRVYNLTTEISKHHIHNFWRPLREGSSDKYLEEVGELGASLLHEVFALPGVNEVFIKPYELSVTKGDAFEWDEIEPDILEALKKCFGETEQEVRVIRSTPYETSPVRSDFDMGEKPDVPLASEEDEA